MRSVRNIPQKEIIDLLNKCWMTHDGMWFAYVGVKGLGAIGKYECGPLYRIKCWLKEFRIKYKFNPEIEGCIMPRRGNCSGEIQLYF